MTDVALGSDFCRPFLYTAFKADLSVLAKHRNSDKRREDEDKGKRLGGYKRARHVVHGLYSVLPLGR